MIAGAALISAFSVMSAAVATVKKRRRSITALFIIYSVILMLHQAGSIAMVGFRLPQLFSYMLCSFLVALPITKRKFLAVHLMLVVGTLLALDNGALTLGSLCAVGGILLFGIALELRIRARERWELWSVRKQRELEEFAVSSRAQGLADMARGIAHEINNPLAIIQATSDRMKALNPSAELDKDLEAINRGVGRIACIVDRLLRCASLPGDQEPVTVTAAILAESALDFWRARISDAGIEIKCTGDLELPLLCRQEQVAQAFSNLIQNSIEAVEHAEIRWIEVSFEQEGALARILVIDSGPRISREVAERMMNPFFTTKCIGKGTGLGLSAARGLIETNHGALWFDRHFGHTCFVIELPIAQESVLPQVA